MQYSAVSVYVKMGMAKELHPEAKVISVNYCSEQ